MQTLRVAGSSARSGSARPRLLALIDLRQSLLELSCEYLFLTLEYKGEK